MKIRKICIILKQLQIITSRFELKGDFVMKATGIVRRIDDLGRIVIPKEIRRVMRISEGTPLEIFTEADNTILLKKYSPVRELSTIAQDYAEGLAVSANCSVCICDTDRIVAVHRAPKKDYLDAMIARETAGAIWEKKIRILGNVGSWTQNHRVAAAKECIAIRAGEDGSAYTSQIIVPILPDGDAVGCIVAFTTGQDPVVTESVLAAVKVTATLLTKQMLG